MKWPIFLLAFVASLFGLFVVGAPVPVYRPNPITTNTPIGMTNVIVAIAGSGGGGTTGFESNAVTTATPAVMTNVIQSIAGGGTATNVVWPVAGQSTHMRTNGQAVAVDVTGTLTNNTSGRAGFVNSIATNAPNLNLATGSLPASVITNQGAIAAGFATSSGSSTNIAFAMQAGAKLLYGLAHSNAPVRALFLGDSMSEITSRNSISWVMANHLGQLYGVSGRGLMGWNLGYGINTFSRPEAAGYFDTPATVRVTDGTNAACSIQGLWWAPSNTMNRVGIVWEKGPAGGTIWVRHINASLGIDEVLGSVQGYAASKSIAYTNWPIAPGTNHSIYLACSATNVVLGPEWVNTNAPGFIDYFYSLGSTTINDMLAPGDAALSNIVWTAHPDLVLWHSKHFESVNNASNLTYVLNLVSNAAPGCSIAVVGSYQSGPTYNDALYNPLIREACRSNNWGYVDLWSAFPDYSMSARNGLISDGLHPNDYGAWIMAGEVERQLGLYWWGEYRNAVASSGSASNTNRFVGSFVGDLSLGTNYPQSLALNYPSFTPLFHNALQVGLSNNATVWPLELGVYGNNGWPGIWVWHQEPYNGLYFDLAGEIEAFYWRSGLELGNKTLMILNTNNGATLITTNIYGTQIASPSFIGNASGATNINGSSIASGIVPPDRLGSGGGAGKFLRYDNTWQTVSASGQTNVTLLAAGSNVTIPSATNDGVITYTVNAALEGGAASLGDATNAALGVVALATNQTWITSKPSAAELQSATNINTLSANRVLTNYQSTLATLTNVSMNHIEGGDIIMELVAGTIAGQWMDLDFTKGHITGAKDIRMQDSADPANDVGYWNTNGLILTQGSVSASNFVGGAFTGPSITITSAAPGSLSLSNAAGSDFIVLLGTNSTIKTNLTVNGTVYADAFAGLDTSLTNAAGQTIAQQTAATTNAPNLIAMGINGRAVTNAINTGVFSFGQNWTTNAGGNIVLGAFGNVVSTHYDCMLIRVIPSGDTRTVTMPANVHCAGREFASNVAYATNNMELEIFVEHWAGIKTNAISMTIP